MIRDFYIRYGAKHCKILISFKYHKIKLVMYVRITSVSSPNYIVVKNRDIMFESRDLYQTLRYYRNELFMLIPETHDLFNQLN